MTESEAREAFLRWRWPDGVECPHCGCRKVWAFKTRPIWRCQGCLRQFSATSGTIFRSRKMPYGEYLKLLVAMGEGKPMYAMNIGHQYKTVRSVLAKWRCIAEADPASSSGRTPEFESGNRGSSP